MSRYEQTAIRRTVETRFGDLTPAGHEGETFAAYRDRRKAANRSWCSPQFVAWAPGRWRRGIDPSMLTGGVTRHILNRAKRSLGRSESKAARRRHLATDARFAAFWRQDARMAK